MISKGYESFYKANIVCCVAGLAFHFQLREKLPRNVTKSIYATKEIETAWNAPVSFTQHGLESLSTRRFRPKALFYGRSVFMFAARQAGLSGACKEWRKREESNAAR
jgi:hypothetical protein